ncbi:MAG TPA: IS200/IS605 family transposase [Verrucomicrobiae bacterium]
MGGTYSNLRLHVVFSTKNREPWIQPQLQERLYPFIGGIVREQSGKLMEIGGMPDHLHLLIGWRTDESISNLLRNIKSRSSAWVHETFPDLSYFKWQEGYGVFSVSHSQAPVVSKYIQNQAEHHRGKTFKEEFISLLKAHDIEYDERYIFE